MDGMDGMDGWKVQKYKMLPEGSGADASLELGGWMQTVTGVGAEDLRLGPMRMTDRVLSLPESVSTEAEEEEEEVEEEEEDPEEAPEADFDRF